MLWFSLLQFIATFVTSFYEIQSDLVHMMTFLAVTPCMRGQRLASPCLREVLSCLPWHVITNPSSALSCSELTDDVCCAYGISEIGTEVLARRKQLG